MIVHPGVTIGEGVVVGSGSVVTSSLESWGVYIGQPARWVRERPRDHILELEQRYLAENDIVPTDFSDVRELIDSQLEGDRLVMQERAYMNLYRRYGKRIFDLCLVIPALAIAAPGHDTDWIVCLYRYRAAAVLSCKSNRNAWQTFHHVQVPYDEGSSKRAG